MKLVSEMGLRESFSRVRKDMQDVRESLAEVIQSLQSLSSKSSGLATKQELKKLSSALNKKYVRHLNSNKKSFSSLKSVLAETRKLAKARLNRKKQM